HVQQKGGGQRAGDAQGDEQHRVVGGVVGGLPEDLVAAQRASVVREPDVLRSDQYLVVGQTQVGRRGDGADREDDEARQPGANVQVSRDRFSSAQARHRRPPPGCDGRYLARSCGVGGALSRIACSLGVICWTSCVASTGWPVQSGSVSALKVLMSSLVRPFAAMTAEETCVMAFAKIANAGSLFSFEPASQNS